jgi:hypothetical protein
MDVAQLSEGLVRISKDEDTYLGVATYLRSNSFAVTKLTAQRRSYGHIVTDEGIETWQPQGFTMHNGWVYLYGPYLEARTLSELLKQSADSVLPYLSRLARALRSMDAEDAPTPLMHTRAIAFLNDGSVLFLPYEIMSTIKDHQTLSDRIEFHDLFNHPDLNAEQNRSFALAVLVYRALTDEYPFEAETDDELRNKMRNQIVTKPIHKVPEIRPEISDLITKMLTDPEQHALSLEQWDEHFSAWIQNGIHRELSEDERLEIEAQAESSRLNMERSYRRREFIRRNWKRIAVISLVVILVGTVPGTMIYNKLQPRAIAGLPPDEVVRTFYTAMNEMDHMTMQDAVVDGAGSGMVREVTNLYVMSRMRTAVERQSSFIDAGQWRDNGMPSFPSEKSVYGTARVRVGLERSISETERVYRAEYEKWQPHFERDENQEIVETAGPGVIGYDRIDRVYLREQGDSWVIYQIERLQNTELSVSDLRAQQQ